MQSTPIIITLDRARPIRWTNRAQARNASLPRPMSFRDLAKRKNSLYAMLAIIWSALVEKDHDFDSPEDMAEYFATEDQQIAALKCIRALIDDAFSEKKSPPSADLSTSGQASSSTSGSASPQSTGGS